MAKQGPQTPVGVWQSHHVGRTDVTHVSSSNGFASFHTKQDFISTPSMITSWKNHQTDMEV